MRILFAALSAAALAAAALWVARVPTANPSRADAVRAPARASATGSASTRSGALRAPRGSGVDTTPPARSSFDRDAPRSGLARPSPGFGSTAEDRAPTPVAPVSAEPATSPPAPRPAPSPRELRATWPYFDRLQTLEGHVSFGVTGVDPGGPRELELWVVGAASPRRLARGRSTPDGRFDFGQQVLASDGRSLVVTPASVGVEALGAAPLASRSRPTSR